VTRALLLAILCCLPGCALEEFVDTARVDAYDLGEQGIPSESFEVLDLRSSGGIVKAVHVRHPSGNGVSIFYCHGVAANIETSWERVAAWYGLGFDVFMFDYRGYGASSGDDWSEASLYADAEAAWQSLLTRSGRSPSEIVIYGHSLGGPVAAEVARRHPPGALVLESTFTSVRDQIRSNTDLEIPDSFLSELELDTKRKVERMGAFQKVFLHGTDDDTWPVWNGKELFRAATLPKRLSLCRGCSHTDVITRDLSWYRDALCFPGASPPLDRCLGGRE